MLDPEIYFGVGTEAQRLGMRVQGFSPGSCRASGLESPGAAELLPIAPPSDAVVLDIVEISPEAVILQTSQGNELVLIQYFPEIKPLLPGARLNLKV